VPFASPSPVPDVEPPNTGGVMLWMRILSPDQSILGCSNANRQVSLLVRKLRAEEAELKMKRAAEAALCQVTRPRLTTLGRACGAFVTLRLVRQAFEVMPLGYSERLRGFHPAALRACCRPWNRTDLG
jgi:hypothetical protein